MTKILIAFATTLFTISTLLTSSAQAGFKGHFAVGLAIGAIGVMAHEAHRYEERERWHKRRYARRQREEIYVSKKSSPNKTTVAKAEEPAETPPLPVAKADAMAAETAVAEAENSSITTASIPPLDEELADSSETSPASVQPAATSSSKLDCRKFFPSVGMTLSVPCE